MTSSGNGNQFGTVWFANLTGNKEEMEAVYNHVSSRGPKVNIDDFSYLTFSTRWRQCSILQDIFSIWTSPTELWSHLRSCIKKVICQKVALTFLW